MATTTAKQQQPRGPAALNPIAHTWKRISPSLVPVLAVLTALIATVPFMVATGARGDLGRGLNIAMTAYSAFIEGSLGIVINNLLTADDVIQARTLAETQALDRGELRQLSGRVNTLVTVGADQVRSMAETIGRYTDQIDYEGMDALGERIPAIVEVGEDNLRAMQPLVEGLAALPGSESTRLLREFSTFETFSDEDRAGLVAVVPQADQYSNSDLLNYLKLIAGRRTVITVQRLIEQLTVLEGLGLKATDADAANFASIFTLKSSSRSGAEIVLELNNADQRLTAAGIVDETTVAGQLNLVNAMYSRNILTEPDVATAINTQLQPFLDANYVVYRPGQDPLLIVPGAENISGTIYNANNTPDDTSDDVPEVVYTTLGNRSLLFFPANLERTLTRSIPFIIAGLAVALGFKAGLFNIGAEGQLYIGGVLAVWVGFSPTFDFLPGAVRMVAVLLMGIIGGGLWGMIPGALKAFTGAHEVINTIMLNFIAIRLTDWLIRSKEPIILRDPQASVDQTPNVHPDAILPRFSQLGLGWILLAGVLLLAWGLYSNRKALQSGEWRYAVRPVVNALLVIVGGIFLSWLTVRGVLHLGLVVMIATVWFVHWFLERTTPGFELRTVGANPNAARYAGMNVKWNIILALTMSGALAGLAGAIELSSVQYNMKPAFFSGLGFDAIAVALLARSNPRSMIPAGLLWAALATGAGPMQLRADIAIDLVKIIQALIIMFIAADAIVRWLWRVPAASEQEKAAATFSKGWGG